MAFLQSAFAGVSTRPVLYLALPVLILGIGYHFFTTYQGCRSHAVARESLQAAIVASAGDHTPVRLSHVTDFPWDRADILVNYKPEGSTSDCPFGWDWSREKREELIATDLLTVIVFLNGGRLVSYLEHPSDQATFVDVKNPYTPETAVFDVSPLPEDPSRFVLSPAS
jgi:hypothetical protein